MSDASLPRRSPRSCVSAPLTSGGNGTCSDRGGGGDGGGGSHLKPTALGFSCKTETLIRRAPQEDIDKSPRWAELCSSELLLSFRKLAECR